MRHETAGDKPEGLHHQASSPTRGATIHIARTTLGGLPGASEAVFTGLYPWSPLSTSNLTKTLLIDRGNWGTWRCRGITPAPMPGEWFKRAAGRPLVYRLDAVRAWLADRRGEPYDAVADWRHCLLTEFGTETHEPMEICRHASMYARAAGTRIGDVSFIGSGFAAYLASLAPRLG